MKTWKRVLLWIVGGLMALLVLGPFLIPVPPLEGTSPAQDVAGPEGQFLELEGLDVYVLQEGKGERAYILLHGFGASTFSWREVIDPLAEDGRVIAYDRPAFGFTERALTWEGDNPYTPEAQVDMLEELLDTLEIQQAVLVGNSAGGTIAAHFALQHPDRVSGLILVDAAIYTGGGSPAWVRPLLNTPQMDHLGPLLTRSIATRGESFLENAYHDPSLITGEIRAGYKRPLQVENWDRALWELTKASRQLDLASQMEDLTVPTLVITGDDDRIVPTAESVRLAGEIPGAVLAVLEDCGHLPQEECPGPFLEAVADFTADLP